MLYSIRYYLICIPRDVDIFDMIHIVDDRYSFHVMLIQVLDDDGFVVFISSIHSKISEHRTQNRVSLCLLCVQGIFVITVLWPS